MSGKTSILLIEDNPLLSGLYKAAFEKVGVDMIVAHDPKEGIELAKEKNPKVILMDFLMVGMNGLEALEKLKSDESTKAIKVIMLTVSKDEDHIKKAKELGAVEYLVKSDLSVEQVVKAVMPHLQG